MLNVLTTKTNKKGQGETFGHDRNVYHLDFSDSFMEIGISPNSLNCIH